MSNVRKALEILRRCKRMSQKFLWREKELVSGDLGSILGLLEDMNRFSDGLPARKSGAMYFKDGPHVNRAVLNRSYSADTSLIARTTTPTPRS
jgi:hypothetical protein